MIEKIVKIEKKITAITLLAIVFLGFLQVVFRGLGFPLAWTEEASLFCFVWFAYMGAAACTLENKHIRVEFLIERLPTKLNLFVKVLINILWLAVCVIIGTAGAKVMFFALTRGSLTVGGKFPYWIAMLSVSVGMLLMGFGVVVNTVKLFTDKEVNKE